MAREQTICGAEHVLALALATACAASVGCTTGPRLSLSDEITDGKSDSVGSHTLNQYVDDTVSLNFGDGYRGQTTVMAHTATTVDISSDELVVQHPRGNTVEAYVDSPHLGTRVAFTLGYRASGSSDAWNYLEYAPEPSNPSRRSRYFTHVWIDTAAGTSDLNWAIPGSGCTSRAVDDGGASDVATPKLTGDLEYRIWVLPIWNWCEWDDDSYDYHLVTGPLAGYGL